MDSDGSTLQLGILGPLEARRGGRRLDLGPFKQRIVLGLLLSRPNKVVSVAALSDAVWQDDVPRTAHKNLQVYVWALRKILGAPRGPEPAGVRIVHRPPGYSIEVGSDAADLLQFSELVRAGRAAARAGDPAGARLLDRALRLWRGPGLADLVAAPALAEEAARLDERYLDAYEDWAEAKLELGEHGDVVDGIEELAQRHPFRERLRRAQMLALSRAGRRTEALARFDAMRQALARELGLGPSPVLLRLYETILAGGDVSKAEPPRRPDPPRPAAGPRSGPGRDVADFTGRTEHVRTLLAMFGAAGRGSGRIAVVSGAAGAGKTALAMHCAHRLGECFPDGWALVGLRGPHGGARPVADVVGDLLRGVGPVRDLPDGLQERAALFRLHAAERRTLIILDDAVAEAHLEAVLAAVGDVDAVVTSRRRLSGVAGVAHLELGPMPDAEAAELLGRLVGPERIAEEPAAAGRLIAACGGLPLALRIAGAKLAALPHMSPARYADRLADDERLLDELAVGELQIRVRLGESHRALSAEDQAVLCALACLECAQFTVPEAAAALGTDAGRAEGAIERLIEAHMVDLCPAGRSESAVRSGSDGGCRYAVSRFTRVFVRELAGS